MNFIFLMLYKIAPNMYAIPPPKSQSKPSKDKLLINGLMAKTITDPMNI